ncbi:hypothetical protein K435DRAFT_773423 [Dendrothele bispora CBS 962.96]|uniref:Trafficking protein particle complex subunit 11 n=1 Tax=Dendrothele bispora (strain CBS 962.96) TaxID=1314807 RepID=A0A4S8MTA0_DENBC|nr:hypothetical protein K435DRAFT_773423 [Dendrothele bispora CBS 962.96]
MNSYPRELLQQLAPVMFVAGLDAPAQTPSAPPTPQAPVVPAENTEQPPQTPTRSQDPFTVLTLRLREALQAQRRVEIWQPDKTKSFQVELVGKDARFPPRKLVPPDDPQYTSSHSPLSPLTPSSPLHPDGIIAPIWIRKHTTLLPSVFVLFMRLYESPSQTPRSPLDLPDPDREREREQDERRKDTDLSAEVAHRKRFTNERGIKLTVVLMASRKMLDDPGLDTRLTFIRRQSGLDSRAALFVLSPVSQNELGDFVHSLQQALYEPALEYYTSHSKRVRRKRNRHASQPVPAYPNPLSPMGGAGVARPLRPEGWTVRYEYKMACFAEFRGEDEVALKHYQDAYEMLMIMFGSPVILPPRTKRWAEAKVLADCINIKITKLYLYNNEHALALSHHNTHMRKFGDFSRGWGIGEDTFEYWSWMARQHRILAELLEQGTRSTLTIPIHAPVVSSSALANASEKGSLASRGALPGMELDAMRSLGINPSQALQHPGYYYYMAARCTEARRARFLVALQAEESQGVGSTSPGFANEKKVDHLVIILELYTKAYELFKKYTITTSQDQNIGRLPLWIAYRIAQTYYDSGKFDMAVRFFERIAKTYRREQWGSMLKPLLETWYACAQQLGEMELSIRLLIERLGHDSDESDPGALEEDLLAIFKSTVPSSPDDPVIIDNIESQPIFDTNVVFWSSEVKINESAAFQLTLTAPPITQISSLPFQSLEVQFSEGIEPIVIQHVNGSDDDASESSIRKIDLGSIATGESSDPRVLQANLRWPQAGSLIFTGTVSSSVPRTITIIHMRLKLVEGAWKVEIPLDPCRTRSSFSASSGRWLSGLDPPKFIAVQREDFSSVNVRYPSHSVIVSLSHQSPAYLNEDYPVTVEITNTDSKELDVVMDVLLQPTDVDYAVNTITLDKEQSSAMIKGVAVGVLAPGVSVVKMLHILSTGAVGDRMIDISVQSRSIATSQPPNVNEDDSPISPALLDITDILQTVTIPTVDPFKTTMNVAYKRALSTRPGLGDLRTFDAEYWDDSDGGEAFITSIFECVGPWNLEIESFVLRKQDHAQAKVLESSIAEGTSGDTFAFEYLPGDEFTDACRVSVASADNRESESLPIPGPGEYCITWRRILPDDKRGSSSTSVFPLPSLHPPVDDLIALLDVTPRAKLHQPVPLTLTIRNRHPTRSANVFVQLETEASDSFVVAGLRSGRVPILLSGAEERLTWNLIPVECGHVMLPRIKIIDKRRSSTATADSEDNGIPVKIVDTRIEQRPGVPVTPVQDGVEGKESIIQPVEEGKVASVLVLP